MHPALLDQEAIARLTAELTTLGVNDHRIQPFRANGCRTPALIASAARG